MVELRAGIALAFLMLVAGPASAQVEPVRGGPAVKGAVAAGASAVAEGVTLGKAGKYEIALGRFEEAARQFPSATHECYVALANLRIGRLTHARLHMDIGDERGDQVPAWCGRDLRKELDAQLEKRGFAPVTIKVEPDDAVVAVGDLRMIGGRTLWLPPGPVTVSAGRAGYGDEQVQGRVPERESESDTVITVLLRYVTVEPVKPLEPEPVERQPGAPVEAEGTPETKVEIAAAPPPGRPLAGWILTGVGAAAVGVGVWFHVAAADTRSRADELATTDPDFAALDSDFSRQRAFAIGGYAVGAVAIGVGTYLLLRPREGRRPARAGLQVGARGALVVLGWEL
jgi:hypothetical protein